MNSNTGDPRHAETPHGLKPVAVPVGTGGGFGIFTVTGYALIPVEVSITVSAPTGEAAIEEAERLFQKSDRKRHYIVPNSADESSVHDFRASTVKETAASLRRFAAWCSEPRGN